MLANVIYNRSDRRYEVASGNETLTFPAGVDGRREAFQAAVQVENPDLHDLASKMADDHPQLASRIWRAVEIVLTDGVTFTNGIGLVVSQSSEYGDYTVQFVDGLYTCDCQDFQGATAVYMEGSEQPYCKHILAYQLALVCD